MLLHVQCYTDGRVAKVEAIDPQHTQEERETHCHTVAVARPVTCTQIPVMETQHTDIYNCGGF